MPEEESTLKMLATVPLFSNVARGHLKGLAKSGTQLSYETGRAVVRQGEKGVGFYLVLDGELEVRKDGKRVASLQPGNFFGEMALFDDQPRTADVVASKPSRCLVFNRWEFWGTIAKEPEVLEALLRETVRRLRSSGSGFSE